MAPLTPPPPTLLEDPPPLKFSVKRPLPPSRRGGGRGRGAGGGGGGAEAPFTAKMSPLFRRKRLFCGSGKILLNISRGLPELSMGTPENHLGISHTAFSSFLTSGPSEFPTEKMGLAGGRDCKFQFVLGNSP